jgi:cell division topological specificity factor
MNLFGFFKRKEVPPATAPVARERLQELLSEERKATGQKNVLSLIKDDIIKALTAHVKVKPDMVKMKVERRKRDGSQGSTLRIAVDLPI